MQTAETGGAPDAAEFDADALVLPIGPEWHALRLECVREVIGHEKTTPVPGAPNWLRGLVNVRGDVLPVVDTARPLGVEHEAEPTHLVLADTRSGRVAVVATGAPQPHRLGQRAGGGMSSAVEGRYPAGEGICTLVDLDALTGAS